MIDHFDRDGTDLRVYQVTASMPAQYRPSEPPLSSLNDIASEPTKQTEPADIPMLTDKSWKGLFVGSERHKVEPTCVYLINEAMGTIQRITAPRQVVNLIKLRWDRFIIPVWGAAIASGLIGLLYTHSLLAFSPGVAIAATLHCLLELKRERMAEELEAIFEGWRRAMASEDVVEVNGNEMIRRMLASA
jgi:hypothetical protein